MQVVGVQPGGSRGFASVQPVVTDARAGLAATNTGARDAKTLAARAQAFTREPVVFPRDGLPLDQRPLNLRQAKAAGRYREAQDLPVTRRRPRR